MELPPSLNLNHNTYSTLPRIHVRREIWHAAQRNISTLPELSECTISFHPANFEAVFTLYRIVKRSVAESVPDRASVHTKNAAFEAVSAPEQYCSAPLLKVERSVSDRFLRRSESSLNTFVGEEIATEPRIGKLSFQIKRERCKLHNE